MALETARGKMYFELRLPDCLSEAQIEECKQGFEAKLDEIDPFNSGTCSRIAWLDQPEVPIKPAEIKAFIERKLKEKGPANLVPIDPPLPIVYCYPGAGDVSICYPAYALELNGKPWGPDLAPGVKVVIVLTNETPFFFSKRELQRSSEKLDRANKKVKKLEKEVRELKGCVPPLRKTGS